MADREEASEPDWLSPLATTSGRIKDELRYDIWDQATPAGGSLATFGGGKGLEFIAAPHVQLLIGIPTYLARRSHGSRGILAEAHKDPPGLLRYGSQSLGRVCGIKGFAPVKISYFLERASRGVKTIWFCSFLACWEITVYSHLKNMRDIDIRRALRVKMGRLHRNDPDTRIVEELGLCQGIARVDLAVVNGDIHGYEIKSERDTLARLPGQTDVYSRSLDFVTIITAPAHAKKIAQIVPPWWGVWTVVQTDSRFELEISRVHRRNPHINAFAFAQLLWRDEALQALIDYGFATGMRSKPREELWRRLASNLSIEELGHVVRTRLKQRNNDWRSPAPQS